MLASALHLTEEALDLLRVELAIACELETISGPVLQGRGVVRLVARAGIRCEMDLPFHRIYCPPVLTKIGEQEADCSERRGVRSV